MEKQFLINQFKLDKHIVFLIKDYAFESMIVRDQLRRYKERNLSYLRERINTKTSAFEMGERDEIIEMPTMFYRRVDNDYDKMAMHLNECWLVVEEEIILLWKKYAIQRENTPYSEHKKMNCLRDNEIEVVLANAEKYDAISWKKCRRDIMFHVVEFDIELVLFKDIYFMCVEGRDIYMQTLLDDGSTTLVRKGVLDEDNDTILIDRHSWWKEIVLESGEMCSINPSTGAIYKHWSYQKANIIGAFYKNEIVLF
jgi:hypothetical protein